MKKSPLLSLLFIFTLNPSIGSADVGLQGTRVSHGAEFWGCTPAQSAMGFVECGNGFRAFPKWLPQTAFSLGRDGVGGLLGMLDDGRFIKPVDDPSGIEDYDLFDRRRRRAGPTLDSRSKRESSLSFLSGSSSRSSSPAPSPYVSNLDTFPAYSIDDDEDTGSTDDPVDEDTPAKSDEVMVVVPQADPVPTPDKVEATTEIDCDTCHESTPAPTIPTDQIAGRCEGRLEFKRFEEIDGFKPDDISKCILRAQAMKQNNENTFVNCENGKFNLTRSPDNRPCLTKPYHQNVVDAYKKALACVNSISSPELSAKEALPLFAHESRFHINQYNEQGSAESASIGQLVIATRKAKRSDATVDDYKALIGDISKSFSKVANQPSCQDFKKFIDVPAGQRLDQLNNHPFNQPKINACYLMRSEDNPEKAMIYSMMAYREAKRQARSYVNRLSVPDNAPKICKDGMSKIKAMQASVINSIATISYHDGSGQVRNRICTLLKEGHLKLEDLTAANFSMEAKSVSGDPIRIGKVWEVYDKVFEDKKSGFKDRYMEDVAVTQLGMAKGKDVFKSGRNPMSSEDLDYEEMSDDGIGHFSGTGGLKCHDY